MSYFIFVNSIVGKRGNIGVRASYIIKHLRLSRKGVFCCCRGVVYRESGVVYSSMGILGHMSRILNAFRIYIYSKFDHRFYDLMLFEWFVKRNIVKLGSQKNRVAHVWEPSPSVISLLKSNGFFVVLDLPMAPTAYNRKLRKDKRNGFLYYNHSMIQREEMSFNLADLIIAPSVFVSNELQKIGVSKDKIRVVEFGVEQCTPSSSTVSENKIGVDFCFFGNVSRRKGVLELIDVWRESEFSTDRLHLCGRLYREVRKSIEFCKSGEILTPGFVDTFEYMRECDVFILPSWLEGSAKASYEAMSAGLVSIVTKSSGSIIRDGIDGFVIEAGDKEALFDRMVWLKNNPVRAREMGLAAREQSLKFTWDRYARKVVKVYEELEGWGD